MSIVTIRTENRFILRGELQPDGFIQDLDFPDVRLDPDHPVACVLAGCVDVDKISRIPLTVSGPGPQIREMALVFSGMPENSLYLEDDLDQVFDPETLRLGELFPVHAGAED